MVMKISLIVGFRAYLTGENDAELELQVREAKKYFPEAEIVVALCGKAASKEVKENANVIHYSDKPLGLTPPWHILTEHAKKTNAEALILVDGDDQHIFSEIKKIYEANKGKVVIPEREKRIILITDSEANRVTLEDLENAYLRIKYNCELKDPQPGLYILNKEAISFLDLSQTDSWVGDMAFLSQLYENNIKITAPKVKVRQQKAGLNLDLIFKRIARFEKYFGIEFLELIEKVKAKPELYLQEGTISELESIKKSFVEYKNKRKVENMKGLILAGGFGKRLRPITYTKQKQLIPIANKPMIFYVIEDLISAGIKDIGIVVGHDKEQIIEEVGDGKKFGCKITYVEQKEPKGLAHAVLVSEDFIKDSDFVMYLGDNLLSGGIEDFVSNFNNSKVDCSILLTKVKDPKRFGIAELNENGQVIKILEKPENPPTNLAVIGVYAFKKSIFEAAKNIKPSARGELEITDSMQYLLEKNYKINAELVRGWWEDTGKPEALLGANQIILDNKVKSENKGKVESGATVTGRVKIGKGSVIKKGTVIRGPSIIGENCEIGGDVYIGPYTSIGDNVKIKNTEIEHSIIFDNTEIDSKKRIVNAIIGQDCKIRSAEETLPAGNKLIIGDNSDIEL